METAISSDANTLSKQSSQPLRYAFNSVFNFAHTEHDPIEEKLKNANASTGIEIVLNDKSGESMGFYIEGGFSVGKINHIKTKITSNISDRDIINILAGEFNFSSDTKFSDKVSFSACGIGGHGFARLGGNQEYAIGCAYNGFMGEGYNHKYSPFTSVTEMRGHG